MKKENIMEEEMYGFDGEWAQTYTKECECGQIIEISTQINSNPEYYTDIFVKCPKCGSPIKFILPMN